VAQKSKPSKRTEPLKLVPTNGAAKPSEAAGISPPAATLTPALPPGVPSGPIVLDEAERALVSEPLAAYSRTQTAIGQAEIEYRRAKLVQDAADLLVEPDRVQKLGIETVNVIRMQERVVAAYSAYLEAEKALVGKINEIQAAHGVLVGKPEFGHWNFDATTMTLVRA
jgi:hypothetical protein